MTFGVRNDGASVNAHDGEDGIFIISAPPGAPDRLMPSASETFDGTLEEAMAHVDDTWPLPMTFTLTGEQAKRARAWMDERALENAGAIGGQFQFRFTPTTLGIVTKVVSIQTGEGRQDEVLDLSDYDAW